MLKIEMLTVETVGALKPLLLELADYHNQTALNFRGCIRWFVQMKRSGLCSGESAQAKLSQQFWLLIMRGKVSVFFRILMSAAVLTIFISGRSCGQGRERC